MRWQHVDVRQFPATSKWPSAELFRTPPPLSLDPRVAGPYRREPTPSHSYRPPTGPSNHPQSPPGQNRAPAARFCTRPLSRSIPPPWAPTAATPLPPILIGPPQVPPITLSLPQPQTEPRRLCCVCPSSPTRSPSRAPIAVMFFVYISNNLYA